MEQLWFTFWSCSKERHRHVLSPLSTDKTRIAELQREQTTAVSELQCFWGWFPGSLNATAAWNGLSPTQKLRAWGKLGCPMHARTLLPLQGYTGCARRWACWDLAPYWDDNQGLASKSEWEACCYFYLLLGGTDWACQELQLVLVGSQRIGSNQLWEYILPCLHLKEQWY